MSGATVTQEAKIGERRRAPSFAALLGLARAVVLWERLWPALWPAAGVAGVFLAVALLDLLPLLPMGLHVVALAAFAAAFGGLAYLGTRRLAPVDERAARHRLEQDSALRHRPLTTIEDRLAGGGEDALARALWHEHLLRAAAAARRLSLRPPSPGLARRDPWALRAAVLLLVVTGLVAGKDEAPVRLKRALVPQPAIVAANLALDIWITPPAYTRRPPVFLKRVAGDGTPAQAGEGAVEPVVVPAGSAVLAQISGL
jgi:hypothetical protein